MSATRRRTIRAHDIADVGNPWRQGAIRALANEVVLKAVNGGVEVTVIATADTVRDLLGELERRGGCDLTMHAAWPQAGLWRCLLRAAKATDGARP